MLQVDVGHKSITGGHPDSTCYILNIFTILNPSFTSLLNAKTTNLTQNANTQSCCLGYMSHSFFIKLHEIYIYFFLSEFLQA